MTNREAISAHLENVARAQFSSSNDRSLGAYAWYACMRDGLDMLPLAWTWAVPTVAKDADDD